jgi:ribosomal protein S18 acetylase RimI-like enzyme
MSLLEWLEHVNRSISTENTMTQQIMTLSLSESSQYAWRPASRADAPLIYAMLLACDDADGTDRAGTLDHVQREFEDTWLNNPETDTLLAINAAGRAAGLGAVFANPEPTAGRWAYLWHVVHPDDRPCGLEEHILSWLEVRAEQVLAAIDSDLPAAIRIGCEDKLHECIALYNKHGFRPSRYFYRMQRDLNKTIAKFPMPEGITFHNYHADMDPALMAALNEAFQDHWGFQPVIEQDWQVWFVGMQDFRPDLSFIAMESEEIVGFSMNAVSPEENQRKGINEGWIHQLGTRRAWRKRGIANALLTETMRAFKAEGLDYATLGVDTQNGTGALGLYERLGFRIVKHYINFEKKPHGTD